MSQLNAQFNAGQVSGGGLAPAAPTLTVASKTTTSVLLETSAYSGPGSHAETDLQVRRKGDADWTVLLADIEKTSGDLTLIEVTGLTTGIAYEARARHASSNETVSDWGTTFGFGLGNWYITQFAEYGTGAGEPNDWSDPEGKYSIAARASAECGQVLRRAAGVDAGDDDGSTPPFGSAATSIIVAARIFVDTTTIGAGVSFNGSTNAFPVLLIDTTTLRLTRYNLGADTHTTLADATIAAGTGERWVVKAERVGDTFRAKAWEWGTVEPAGWMIEETDALAEDAGAQVRHLGTPTSDIDLFALAWNGTPLPELELECGQEGSSTAAAAGGCVPPIVTFENAIVATGGPRVDVRLLGTPPDNHTQSRYRIRRASDDVIVFPTSGTGWHEPGVGLSLLGITISLRFPEDVGIGLYAEGEWFDGDAMTWCGEASSSVFVVEDVENLSDRTDSIVTVRETASPR